MQVLNIILILPLNLHPILPYPLLSHPVGEIIGLLARAKRLLAAIRAARSTGGRDVKASLKRFVR